MFYILIILGILIRLILIPHPGFEADMAYWKSWGLAASDKGIVWLVNNTNFNYPPGFAYILVLVHKIYSLFKDPHNIAEFWLNNNILYLYIFKSLTVIADIGIVILLLLFAKKFRSPLGFAAAAFYFLNPAVLFDGAVWGQVDQFGLFLFLLSFYLLLEDRYAASSIIFTISCLMKFQNIIFIPLYFLFIFKKSGYQPMVKSVATSVAVFIIITAPLLLSQQAGFLIKLLTVNFDWFPYYSLHAYNIWWIVAGLEGMGLSDKNLVLGIINAKQLGLLFFIAAYFAAFIAVIKANKELLIKRFIISCGFVVMVFFHILTESHDRYLFHLLGFLPLIVLADAKKSRQTLFFAGIFSVFFFLNLYVAMYVNYPKFLFWPGGKELAKNFSLFISLGQIGLFVAFFLLYMYKSYIKLWIYNGAILFIVVGMLVFQNRNYIAKKPISLSDIEPVAKSQEYLSPVKNMTVDSQLDPMRWNRLSTNYFFYREGIGSHADSTIIYALNGKFSKFQSDYGVDTEGHETAAVVFAIEGDGRELFRSKPKGRFDNPSTVSVSIKGVKNLALKIYKAGKSNFGAHADWLKPVIIR